MSGLVSEFVGKSFYGPALSRFVIHEDQEMCFSFRCLVWGTSATEYATITFQYKYIRDIYYSTQYTLIYTMKSFSLFPSWLLGNACSDGLSVPGAQREKKQEGGKGEALQEIFSGGGVIDRSSVYNQPRRWEIWIIRRIRCQGIMSLPTHVFPTT